MGEGVGSGVSLGGAVVASAVGDGVAVGVGAPSPTIGSVELRLDRKMPKTTAPRMTPITAAIEIREFVSVGMRPVGTTRA